jgi:hypothetical protein
LLLNSIKLLCCVEREGLPAPPPTFIPRPLCLARDLPPVEKFQENGQSGAYADISSE